MKKLIAVLATSLFLTACSTKMAEYTLVSNRTIDISHSDNFVRGSMVNGNSGGGYLFILPLGGVASEAEALKNAIDSDRCAVALSDVTVEYHEFNLPLILGIKNTAVSGRKILDTAISGCENRK